MSKASEPRLSEARPSVQRSMTLMSTSTELPPPAYTPIARDGHASNGAALGASSSAQSNIGPHDTARGSSRQSQSNAPAPFTTGHINTRDPPQGMQYPTHAKTDPHRISLQHPSQSQTYYGNPSGAVQNVQPGFVPAMSTSGRDVRNLKHLPKNEEGKRKWGHNICGCFKSCGTCKCLFLTSLLVNIVLRSCCFVLS